jgi:hypothetical protein
MGVGAVVVLLLAVGVQAGAIFAAGAVLLCPLMMIFGMGMFGRGMVHHGHHTTDAQSDQTTTSS